MIPIIPIIPTMPPSGMILQKSSLKVLLSLLFCRLRGSFDAMSMQFDNLNRSGASAERRHLTLRGGTNYRTHWTPLRPLRLKKVEKNAVKCPVSFSPAEFVLSSPP